MSEITLSILGGISAGMGIHGGWFLVESYHKKYKVSPPLWLLVITIFLPYISHIAIIIKFYGKKIKI